MHWSEADYQAYLARHPGLPGSREVGASGVQPPGPALRAGPSAAPGVSEKVLMNAIARLAREHGWYWYHTWSSKRSPAGFPDGCLVHPTRRELPVYLVELKTATGQVTPAQQAWLNALNGRQVVSGVWRPEDWSTIVARLSR